MAGNAGTQSTKLIVLRGNSASGKTSVATGIRNRHGRGIAIVSQDNLRRTVLRERDTPDGALAFLRRRRQNRRAPDLPDDRGSERRLGLAIVSAYAEGDEPQLAAAVLSQYSGVVLICWEYDHIPSLASSVPAVQGTAIPQTWPGDRFDVIRKFTLVPGAATAPVHLRADPAATAVRRR